MTEEQYSMEMAIRVSKWKSQLGELYIKKAALEEDLKPKLRQMEDINRDIGQYQGALSEAFAVQVFIEDNLRLQGKLGRDARKHVGSILDKADKLEENVGEKDGNHSRSWAKSGSVSL